MNYRLPTTVTLDGAEYKIRTDYRDVLTLFEALNDPELNDAEKAIVLVECFYEDEVPVDQYGAAIRACFDFISAGEESDQKGPRLVDWEKDFPHIVAPINRVLGQEVRSLPYLHWWTFLSAFNEIGDCTFAQIVRVRDLLARGKKLDKTDREWLKKNRHLVVMKQSYSQAEDDLVAAWTGGNRNG